MKTIYIATTKLQILELAFRDQARAHRFGQDSVLKEFGALEVAEVTEKISITPVNVLLSALYPEHGGNEVRQSKKLGDDCVSARDES